MRGKRRKTGRLLKDKFSFFAETLPAQALRFRAWQKRLTPPAWEGELTYAEWKEKFISSDNNELLEFVAVAMTLHGYDPDNLQDAVLPEWEPPKIAVEVLLDRHGLSIEAMRQTANYVAWRWAGVDVKTTECLTIDHDDQLGLARQILTYGDIEKFLWGDKRHKTAADVAAAYENGDEIFTYDSISKIMQRYKSDK